MKVTLESTLTNETKQNVCSVYRFKVLPVKDIMTERKTRKMEYQKQLQ